MSVITVKLVVSVLIGGVAGFAYYRLVGCSSGSCPITSNPYASIFYGMLMGGFIGWK